ncbi:hypothetical protein B0H67DRAFT_569564 [Lasiosphaeris hirsuta]|uniref:Uncharacterized protein n=1 Tax=Lasiosphaeris hirsuta TaxID=260670 RepID=A0AA40AZX0_9PEZI|nr:hypothetical protein B0H67DRAFT_569564 [Lasiosphaeris hirsuta]
MGYFVGVTSTGFVGTDEMSAVTSFQPCHIFGDQMLIGTGIRVGFYLLYAAAIIAVLFGVDKQFRFWHGVWGIVALSLFVTMMLNVVAFNLIIIDYAVLIELILWYPVFFLFTILFRQALVVEERTLIKPNDEIPERLRKHGRETQATSSRDAAQARAYINVLKAFALYAIAEEAEDESDLEDARAALGQSLRHLVSHWRERTDSYEDHRRAEHATDGGVISAVYSQDVIDEIAAAPTREDVNRLRDLYVATLACSLISVAEARATEQEVALVAAEELRIRRRNRPASHAVRHFLITSSYKDQLAAALGLLVWSMYMFGTAALNWPLLTNGNKPGQCDNVPTVYFVFAPKKPFTDAGFVTFLRVWAVIMCIVAVFTTAVAIFILVVSLLGPSVAGMAVWSRGEKGKGRRSIEAGPSDFVYDVRGKPDYSRRARGQHAQEILGCLYHTESRTIRHRYHMRTTSPIHFTLWNVPWAILLAVLLVATITCAELTIQRQGPNNDTPLDFARPPLHETAEILVLLAGLYSLALTCLSVVGAIVSAILRPRRRAVETGHRSHGRQKLSREPSHEKPGPGVR